MEFIALSAPVFLIFLACLSIASLFLRKFRASVTSFALCLAVNWLFSIFPVVGAFHTSGDSNGLKVLTFNCNLHYREQDYLFDIANVQKLLVSIDADVVFLTENYFHDYDTLWRSVRDFYPYRVCDSSTSGNCIYSKYNIKRVCKSKEVPNCITPITVRYQKADIMIIGCHLSSNNYDEDDVYQTPDKIERFEGALSYLKSIGYASGKRVIQAKHVDSMIRENVPTIVLGDINDVCGSPCLHVLKESGFKDGWWEKGLGYGATIHHLIPFRIDHVMHNNNIELLNIEKIDCSSISDHDALVALFKLR